MGGIRTVNLAKFRNFLKHSGFIEKRQKGSHLIFDKFGLARSLIVAVHGKGINFYDCLEVIKILNITREEFFKELRKY